MKIKIAIVDLSALPRWPHYILGAADVYRSIDRHHALRQASGRSLAPPRITVTGLPDPEGARSRLLLTEIEP